MIFVDSGTWIALSNPKDNYHDMAVAINRDLRQQEAQLVTTDYVIDETATRLKYDADHSIAVQLLNHIEQLEREDILDVVVIDDVQFQEAKELFRQYDSAKISFTDCTSFVVCQERDIFQAFAFDAHFTIVGITLLQ